jgi:Mrp family chromosome partitioning ATPase
MSGAASRKAPEATVVSLAQLLEQQPGSAPPCLVELGLLPPQGILFVGGEPKVGKSLLVANLALALAAGSGRAGFSTPAPRQGSLKQWGAVRRAVKSARRILGFGLRKKTDLVSAATPHHWSYFRPCARP